MNIPFVQARHYRSPRKAAVRLIVIHDMEAPEISATAENIANYFRTTNSITSTHYNVDNNSVVQSVREGDVAFCAPGANEDGIHIEHAGYAKQTAAQWLDAYSTSMLKVSAQLVGELCDKYNIPVRRLTDAQLRDGVTKGIVGHADVSRVFKQSTHTDPGPGFPWAQYLAWVKAAQGDDMPLTAADAKLVVDTLMVRPVNTTKNAQQALSEGSYANDAHVVTVQLAKSLAALQATANSLATELAGVKASLAVLKTGGIDLDALSSQVAARLGPALAVEMSKRLAE